MNRSLPNTAAIAGLPAVDTVKQVERTSEGAIVKATIPRAGIVLAQTPQGFHYRVIKKAFDEAAADRPRFGDQIDIKIITNPSGKQGNDSQLSGRQIAGCSRCIGVAHDENVCGVCSPVLRAAM